MPACGQGLCHISHCYLHSRLILIHTSPKVPSMYARSPIKRHLFVLDRQLHLYRMIRSKDARSSAFRVAYQAVSSVAALQKSHMLRLSGCPKGSLHKGMSSKDGIAMSAGRRRAPTKSRILETRMVEYV